MFWLLALLGVIIANGALIQLRRRRLQRMREELGPGRGRVPREPEEHAQPVDLFAEWSARPPHACDLAFRSHTRLSRADFLDLLGELRPAIEANREVRLHVPPPTGRYHPTKMTTENRLLMALTFLVCANSETQLAVLFGVSRSVVSEDLRHVIHALVGTIDYEIVLPDEARRQQLGELLGPPFHLAFGTVDGTFTPTFRLRGDYSGHRHTPLRSHQIACDALGYIVHIVAGQIGARHDAFNFARSDLPDLLRACGFGLLADSGYEGTGGTLLTPSTIAARFPDPAQQQLALELHTSRRSRIEQFIGIMKALFRVLANRWQRTDRAFLAVCVVACAMLYNRVRRLRV